MRHDVARNVKLISLVYQFGRSAANVHAHEQCAGHVGRKAFNSKSPDNVRVIPDAGDVEIVGADTIAKQSAETSEGRSIAAWDQRIVITRLSNLCTPHIFYFVETPFAIEFLIDQR